MPIYLLVVVIPTHGYTFTHTLCLVIPHTLCWDTHPYFAHTSLFTHTHFTYTHSLQHTQDHTTHITWLHTHTGSPRWFYVTLRCYHLRTLTTTRTTRTRLTHVAVHYHAHTPVCTHTPRCTRFTMRHYSHTTLHCTAPICVVFISHTFPQYPHIHTLALWLYTHTFGPHTRLHTPHTYGLLHARTHWLRLPTHSVGGPGFLHCD